jgi:hypothetical protein
MGMSPQRIPDSDEARGVLGLPALRGHLLLEELLLLLALHAVFGEFLHSRMSDGKNGYEGSGTYSFEGFGGGEHRLEGGFR